jgi:hypothetical protein
MLEYTKTVFNQTIDDIKKISLALSFATQGIYISYLIYALCVKIGIAYVNALLLAISLLYLVFSVAMEQKVEKRLGSKIKAKGKDAYKIARYVILLPTLITSIITVATESHHVTYSLLFAVIMILGYVLSVLMMVAAKLVESRFNLFMIAIKADFEPMVNAYNTFRKFKGERVAESAPDKSEQRIRAELDSKVDKIKSEFKKETEKMSKEELIEVRKEIITSIASNIKEKAKQKLNSFASKLSTLKSTSKDENASELEDVPSLDELDSSKEKDFIEK